MSKAKETIGNLKDISESLGEISKSMKQFATVAKALEGIGKFSAVLGVAGPIIGILLSFMGGSQPDPELLKIQKMIEETQVMISQGFLDLEK